MVLAALGYGAMRGWHDYRRAQAELEVLLPFYEDRVQRLGAAHATEREAMMAWEAVNEQYVALLTTNEEKKATASHRDESACDGTPITPHGRAGSR
jgi:hypothetical protein